MKSLYALIVIASLIAGIVLLAPTPPVYAQGSTCNQTASVSMASGTVAVIIQGLGAANTFICGFLLTTGTAAATGQFTYGTGTRCGTGSTNLSPALVFGTILNMSFARDTPIWTVSNPGGTSPALPDVCLTSATGGISGFVVYGKY